MVTKTKMQSKTSVKSPPTRGPLPPRATSVTKPLVCSSRIFYLHKPPPIHTYLCVCWRRQWQPTPVLLPGESQGQQSLVGCRPWGRAESDTTEVT